MSDIVIQVDHLSKRYRLDVIGKLHRYEAHIERGLYRALHELQRLQATRQGQAVPAPMALDITLNPAPAGN